MYQCRANTFTGKSRKVFSKGKEFFRQWYADTGTSPPSIRVPAVSRRPILINWLKRHIDAKPVADKITRYRILPCVRELLENTPDSPVQETDESGEPADVFYGLTPQGWEFKVTIKRDRHGCLRLISCYRSRD
jgi:hypothetical protein